jgi:hypothetical protein
MEYLRSMIMIQKAVLITGNERGRPLFASLGWRRAWARGGQPIAGTSLPERSTVIFRTGPTADDIGARWRALRASVQNFGYSAPRREQ